MLGLHSIEGCEQSRPIATREHRPAAIVWSLAASLVCWGVTWSAPQLVAAEPASIAPVLQQYCFDCHGNEEAAAGINLERLAANQSFAVDFRKWQQAVDKLKEQQMPPQEADQPDEADRRRLLDGIRNGLREAVDSHTGDPGHVVIRRLTSAEYRYTILDLTGLDLDVHRSFVSDAVGGAGFTNTGIAQFVQDSTLERYLEAAGQVAQHAVIGAGPLVFHADPGQTGFELSAITRIQEIYRAHGFRSASGEGGEPFGLDKYPGAFYAAWLIEHRGQLGGSSMTMKSAAAEAGVDVRFAEYMHKVVTQEQPSFPTSAIVDRWSQLPLPEGRDLRQMQLVRSQCDQIAKLMHDWQNRFGANPDAKEEAPVLRADLFEVSNSQQFEMNVNWPEETETAHLVLSVESAIREGDPDAVVIWRNAKVLFRFEDRQLEEPRPLREFITTETSNRLKIGTHPRNGKVGPEDFVTVGTRPPAFELPIPAGAGSAQLLVTAELDVEQGEDCIVRCAISQLEETDQGTSVSGLVANPNSAAFAAWKAGVLEFARQLPQVSQREPAPSDRDPIPSLVDPSYNNPERNHFHIRMKYHRDDRFLVENVLDDETRVQLDQAWADLLGSFEFHDAWLQFVARKFDVELDGRLIADIDDVWIARLPQAARHYVQQLRQNYHAIHQAFEAAHSRQVEDVIEFAAVAWRRALSKAEQDRLREFYRTLRAGSLDHRAAIRALITRVLVAPEFLFRSERVAETEVSADDRRRSPLSSHELASRLSYFLWSSLPDSELRRAADAGELREPQHLMRQSRRMLKDPKARRFATEFFGQWFGFYRFDQYRGIDPERFPELSQRLKSSMYTEAVTFCDHIVRNDRPLNEILFADYSFLNQDLARHYGIDDVWQSDRRRDHDGASQIDSEESSQPEADISPVALETDSVQQDHSFQKVDGLNQQHRGGLLRLGAVLTVTSAPMRTSPVKRGDWILRRTLGTPVPPPPADAGSIPADDILSDGLSVRQRLEAHRTDASCANCHSRIDALGFALENYDPLGRWREEYRDGTPIDTSGALRDGTEIANDRELHEYLESRRALFHRTLNTKLLSYALGRRETVGDLPLLDEMNRHLGNDGGISRLVQSIVGSRQFRYHAGSVRLPERRPSE
jgi:hypothetical protein